MLRVSPLCPTVAPGIKMVPWRPDREFLGFSRSKGLWLNVQRLRRMRSKQVNKNLHIISHYNISTGPLQKSEFITSSYRQPDNVRPSAKTTAQFNPLWALCRSFRVTSVPSTWIVSCSKFVNTAQLPFEHLPHCCFFLKKDISFGNAEGRVSLFSICALARKLGPLWAAVSLQKTRSKNHEWTDSGFCSKESGRHLVPLECHFNLFLKPCTPLPEALGALGALQWFWTHFRCPPWQLEAEGAESRLQRSNKLVHRQSPQPKEECT